MAKSRKRPDTDRSAQSPTATVDRPADDSPDQLPESQPNRDDVRMDNSHRERVAQRAYELYLSRGGSHGSDWEDWLAAERELMGNTSDDEPSGSGRG